MWRGYPFALAHYGLAICTEWISRGYRDTCFEKIDEMMWHGLFDHASVYDTDSTPHAPMMPPWLGDDALHISHQSNLIRKDPAFYRPIFSNDVSDDLPYVWPMPWTR